MSDNKFHILAGDIGGTNARLVLYETRADPDALLDVTAITRHRVVSQMYYKNNDFTSFSKVLCSFTALPANAGRKIHAACLATAGPVSNNRINFTNREGWIIDGRAIREEYAIEHVQLVNDFVANGYGLLGLDASEVVELQHGTVATPEGEDFPHGRAPKALVGAGTGLGECFLTPAGDTGFYQAYASEGGHVEFAPRTQLEEELLHYLQDKLDLPQPPHAADAGEKPRVSVERVVSGKGLENIYEFLRTKFPDDVNPHLDADYNESSERGRLIGAEKYNYNLFQRTLEIMFAIYGGEVGNVALKFLPQGGVYIAGGIAPKNIEFINAPGSIFMRRFLDKGRMGSIMAQFPVYVVLKEDLGMRGAHIVAARLAGQKLTDRLTVPRSHAVEKYDSSEERGNAMTRLAGKRAQTFRSESLRNAIADYPVTYAVATSLTSVATAAAIVLGGQLIARNSSVR